MFYCYDFKPAICVKTFKEKTFEAIAVYRRCKQKNHPIAHAGLDEGAGGKLVV